MRKLAPSILSADFAHLGDEISRIDRSAAEYIHIDVMDGTFVQNISIGFPTIKAIRSYTKKVFDVHLMVEEPWRYFEATAEAGADIICIHEETCNHIHGALQKIRELGCRSALALNPHTPLDRIRYVMDDLDMILIMSVDPGFGGAKFIPAMTSKIADARKMLSDYGRKIDIEVDGGIHLGNVEDCLKSGADVIVSGSAVFRGDVAANIEKFDKILQKYNE